MVKIQEMLPDLQKLVGELTEDLHEQATTKPEIAAYLGAEYEKTQQAERNSQTLEEWRADILEQVAVAWVLACVFVRFLEDNELVNKPFLAGMSTERDKLAAGEYDLFFRKPENRHATDREYLHNVFREFGSYQATKEIFEEGKTPLWAVDLSGDGARRLRNFFRERNGETGELKRSFNNREAIGESGAAFTQEVTEIALKLQPQFRFLPAPARFLGDLYQDLSESARKKYALLQTPDFVEEFILDRTLDPALETFGLRGFRLIDPTCGSGHFLLGAFDRLFKLWTSPEYFGECNENKVSAAQNALDSVFGVDVNPYAVAISRFRLTLAALVACDIDKLSPQNYDWQVNVVPGDSLLWGAKPGGVDGGRVPIQHQQNLFDADPLLAVEDPAGLNRILGQGYHAVVGNPPYITVKDKAQNAAYREYYSQTCHGKYSLGVPFTQRFWELALRKGEPVGYDDQGKPTKFSHGHGYAGMITANSFMKREFGKKLIESFFPTVNLTHVLDTSGAYIPGHGTPTVILLGRPRLKNETIPEQVRAVLGIRGEPETPDDPAEGEVWRSIVRHIDQVGTEDEFTSTADVDRETFSQHPWSLSGGGAVELMTHIERHASSVINDMGEIGIGVVTLQDEAYQLPPGSIRRLSLPSEVLREFVTGDAMRDWSLVGVGLALFPHQRVSFDPFCEHTFERRVWPLKSTLSGRLWFRKTQVERGLEWFEYGHISVSKFSTPLSLAFSEVATHNHFVLDRGGKVFNQTAPIIKLSAEASEEEHLCLLGPANSSTACFWFKQACHNKGSTVDKHGARQRTDAFEDFYQLNGTRVGKLPVPDSCPVEFPRKLESHGRRFADLMPDTLVRYAVPTTDRMMEAEREAAEVRRLMIALQEELDWQCYRLYGLLEDDLCHPPDDVPPLSLGERAFEVVMARQMAAGELETSWFERHRSTPITDLPPTGWTTTAGWSSGGSN